MCPASGILKTPDVWWRREQRIGPHHLGAPAIYHDEQANVLARNLAHDIVTGAKSVQGARDYTKEFADYRRKQPTPYMERLHFIPGAGDAADPDVRVLSEEELQQAVQEGKQRG